ncbi:MAG: ATP-grasp domain-containing protein [Nanoarchaeota archaeon]|nr:ATP-grasp domain-containing protein [Nanoarchaeota archaeon]
MKLLVVASKKDLSCNRIIKEAEKKKIEVSKIIYGDDLKPEQLKEFDFCMIRDAYSVGKDFPDFLRTILSAFRSNQLFDDKMYEKYSPCESKQYGHPQDKLFQHLMYEKAANMPKFWDYDSVDKIAIKSFPIVIKQKIGERGKEVFILESEAEIEDFFNKRDIKDFFFEEFLELDKDIRVIVLNHEVLGSVNRRVRFKDNQGYKGVGVKVIGKYKVPEEIKDNAVEVSHILGSEFCGLDFGIDKKGHHYLMECNVSPWFSSAERILDMNIAKKIVEFILEKQN